MNDDQLTREIEQALSVNPSPQFVARVRTRIAARREASWLRWSFGALALASVAVVVALGPLESKQTSVLAPAEVVVKVPQPKADGPPMPTLQGTAQKSTPIKAEPEVLFDPREAAAFQKFVEGVRDKRIDLGQLVELQQAASQTAPIEEIALMPIDDLAPIVIESLSSGPRRIEGGSL
jgi:hypothetical protein